MLRSLYKKKHYHGRKDIIDIATVEKLNSNKYVNIYVLLNKYQMIYYDFYNIHKNNLIFTLKKTRRALSAFPHIAP